METKTINHFASEVKNLLPPFFQEIVNNAKSEAEADMMLMGAITTLSAALPNVYGIYDNAIVYPNFYLFVLAKASAGKGRLAICKELVKPIHKTLQTNTSMPNQSLLIPGNSSATAMYQQLWFNNGHGLIFETEADTLYNVIKSSFGNFSDGLRKAFHHETISYLRRKENEWVEIDEPHLSVVLSSTPHQCKSLLSNVENGLFSRFAIMHLPSNYGWKNVFDKTTSSDYSRYKPLGNRVLELYRKLRCNNQPIEFKLTPEQEELFNEHFNSMQESYSDDDNFMAIVRRMGLITFRIAMTLSILRHEELEELTTNIVCTDDDFLTAITISQALILNAKQFYDTMPEGINANKILSFKEQQKENLLNMLPNQFSRKDMITASQPMNISSRTIDTYIREYLNNKQIENVSFGVFRKTETTLSQTA